jgi:hypothetical protein
LLYFFVTLILLSFTFVFVYYMTAADASYWHWFNHHLP